MPVMANITVKKADGTTDIVWTAQQTSAGDRSPATWRSTTVGAAPMFQPEMSITSRPNTDGSVRRVDGYIDYKQTAVGTDGVTRKIHVSRLKFDAVVPQGMDSIVLNEWAIQACNLLASTLVKQVFRDGYAPT